MYNSHSSYGAAESAHQQYPLIGGQQASSSIQITPGSITYTTSRAADGTITYHPFKAVAASYQTPSGIVSGIQWVPAEATQVLPQGAQPANSSFVEAWNRGNLSTEDQKAIKEWQKAEEKRRKKEENEPARTLRERSRSRSRGEPDVELLRARERDAMARERRKSFNQGQAPYHPIPPSPAGMMGMSSGYRNPHYNTLNPPSSYGPGQNVDPRFAPAAGVGLADLNRQFAEMDMNHPIRERKISRPSKYSSPDSIGEKTRRLSNVSGDRPVVYSGSGTVPSYPVSTGNIDAPFIPPNVGGTAVVPHVRSSSPNYPSGPNIRPQSRAPSPAMGATGAMPYPGTQPAYAKPDVGQQQLPTPDGFIRPVNPGLPYTPFETMKIQEMDEFLESRPQIPAVLKHHDVYPEDWARLMNDISLAWSGRLPVPHLTKNGHQPKRGTLTADLIDLWNVSFFVRRGVEVILYKGRQRRSGQRAGVMDLPQHLFEGHAISSSSDSEDESEVSEDERAYGFYGRPAFAPGQGSMAEVLEARRRRKEFREEQRRRKLERKIRKREKAREKKYALYINCVRPGGSVNPPQGMMNSMGLTAY